MRPTSRGARPDAIEQRAQSPRRAPRGRGPSRSAARVGSKAPPNPRIARVDARSARSRAVLVLEHQDDGALGGDEAVPAPVERARHLASGDPGPRQRLEPIEERMQERRHLLDAAHERAIGAARRHLRGPSSDRGQDAGLSLARS